MQELNGRLIGGCKGEDMLVRPLAYLSAVIRRNLFLNKEDSYSFQDRQIKYHAASVEVLEASKNDMIAVLDNFLIAISWIDSATNEKIVFDDQLLGAIVLFICPSHCRRSCPQKMISQ